MQVLYGRHAADHAAALGHEDPALLSTQKGIRVVLQSLWKAGLENIRTTGGVELADLGQVPFFREAHHGDHCTLGSWARDLAMSASVGMEFCISPSWNFS